MMTLGEKITAARKDAGLTQEKLAQKLGVTFQAISAWERNESVPDTKRLIQISKVLGLNPYYLFADDENDWKLKISDQQGLLERAIEFATVKHTSSFIGGTTIPYITHAIEVLGIVSELTNDEEIHAAAVLHDTLDVTETTKDELALNFGQPVAALVAAISENKQEKHLAEDALGPRKNEALVPLNLSNSKVRIIVLGDELSNIRSLHRAFDMPGETVRDRYSQNDLAIQGRYYCSVVDTLGKDESLSTTHAFKEFTEHIEALFSEEGDSEEYNNTRLKLQFMTPRQAQTVEDKSSIKMLILDPSTDEDLIQIQIMAMIVDAILRTEGVGFTNVHLSLENSPNQDDVYWERTQEGYRIQLCVESGMHWCQVAYQLGYAMMHCLIDHIFPEGKVTWAEELICEASALEVLNQLQIHWEETPFFEKDTDYSGKIKQYIEDNLGDEGTSALLRCSSLDELKFINAWNEFDDRIDESHNLFHAIQPGDLGRLAQIRKYTDDNGLLIHTRFWRIFSERSKAIDYICRLQERIPGCDLPVGIPHEIDLKDSKPTDEQIHVYTLLIRSLQALPFEHIIFSFLDSDKGEKEQIGLVFYQLYRKKRGAMNVEMRLDTKNGRRMYRKITDDTNAAAILANILRTNEVPDVSEWEDITAHVFKSKA